MLIHKYQQVRVDRPQFNDSAAVFSSGKREFDVRILFRLFALLFASISLLCAGHAQGEQSAEILEQQGQILFQKGDYDRAIAVYTKAIALFPDNYKTYNNRGRAWFYKSDYDQAIADYSKALGINPSYSEACSNRGTAWFYNGDPDRAIVDYTKAIEINPNDFEAYFCRGVVRYHQGDYYWAIADYSRALTINPDYALAYNQLSWTLAVCPDARFRNGAKALEMAVKAVELSTNNHTLDTLAAAYAEAGKFEDAVMTQEKVINLLQKEERAEALPGYEERLKFYKARQPWRELNIASKVKSKKIPRIEVIKNAPANVHVRPATTSLIVNTLKTGDKVELVGRQAEWYIIKLPDDRTGWAHQRLFLTKGSADIGERKGGVPFIKGFSRPLAETRDAATLNVSVGRVRQSPSFDAEIIFKLRKGETVFVSEAKGDWYRVELKDGSTGWAHQSLFSMTRK